MSRSKLTGLGCGVFSCLLLAVVVCWDGYKRKEDMSVTNRRRLGKLASLEAKPVYVHNLDEDSAKLTCLAPALINLEYKTNKEIRNVREKLLSALMKGTVKIIGKDLQKCGTILERGVRRLEFSALSINVITTDAADSPSAPEKKVTRRRLNHLFWANATRTNGTNGTNVSVIVISTTRLNCQGNSTLPTYYPGFEYASVVYQFTTSFIGYLRLSVRGAYGYAPPYVNLTVRSSLTSPPDYKSCGAGACPQRNNASTDQTFAVGTVLVTPPNIPFSTGSTRLRGMSQYLFVVTGPKWWVGWIQLRLQCCPDFGCNGRGTTAPPLRPETTMDPRVGLSTTANPKSPTITSKISTSTSTSTSTIPGTTPKPALTTASSATCLEFVQSSLFLLVISMLVV